MVGQVELSPLQDLDELRQLEDHAAEDNHIVIGASHVFRKEGEIVGYCSVGHTIHWWMHTAKCGARDSISAITQMEAILRDRGIQEYHMLCATESPYTQYLEKIGFEKLGTTTVYRKK